MVAMEMGENVEKFKIHPVREPKRLTQYYKRGERQREESRITYRRGRGGEKRVTSNYLA